MEIFAMLKEGSLFHGMQKKPAQAPDQGNVAPGRDHNHMPTIHAIIRKAGLLNKISGLTAGVISSVVLLFYSGCQTPNTAMMPENPVLQTPVCLAAGDVIKLSFSGTPEYNQTQKIRSDGKISLPLIGEVQAAGKRIGQFQEELSLLYKSQLQNSEVVVALDNEAAPVYVSGAVNHPGKIVVDGPMTVLEAIMEAGGFVNGLANTKKVRLIRVENGHQTTHILDLSPALKGQPGPAFYLKPKDMIFVPESLF